MNDLISRADLINYLDICINDTNGKPPLTDAVLIAIKCAVELIPSVDAETIVHGQWVKNEAESENHVEPIFFCSACQNWEAWGFTELTNYCPYCGAKMDDVNNDERTQSGMEVTW